MKKLHQPLLLLVGLLWFSQLAAVCPSPNIFKSNLENLLPSSPNPSLVDENDAARFLTQATFGATLNEIRNLQSIGFDLWLEQQLNAPATLQEPCLQATLANPDTPLFHNSRMESWFLNSAEGQDQLRQRMAFALSQLFVISDQGNLGVEVLGIAKYYDLLAQNAFGNFRDLLEDVTLNTMMGFYLGMFKNAKADPVSGSQPDENYAREVLQLFTIGLHQLEMNGTVRLDNENNPIPTYNQTTIENFARVFTGWNYAGCADNNWNDCNPLNPGVSQYAPMEAIEAFHDTESKTLLNGVVIPADQTAQQDLTAALDNIFNHPNVAPFVSKQLIQRFVTSNPSSDYIERVANIFADNGQGVRGDLRAVIRAILLDDEARNPSFVDEPTYGKLKEPLIRHVALLRAFGAKSASGRYANWNPEFAFLQRPLGSPSVFNFYKPSYQLPGPIRDQGLTSPEFQITTETSIVTVANAFSEATTRGHHQFQTSDPTLLLMQLQGEVAILDDPEALLDHLNLLLFSGQMPESTRQVALDLLSALESSLPASRVASLIYVLILSPEYVIQR